MIIAGKKTKAACYRYRNFIARLPSAKRAELASAMKLLSTLDAAYNAVRSLAAQCGIENDTWPATKEEWVDAMVTEGIPVQVWMGVLSYTTYSRPFGVGNFARNYDFEIRAFAEELRTFVCHFAHCLREINDLLDVGGPDENNPAGLPDGLPGH